MKAKPSLIQSRASWVMQACDELGKISQSESFLDRRYLTKEHAQANALVSKWMSDCQMQTWQDSVGNIWGRRPGNSAHCKSIVLGSHLDTVVDGGKYDGMLGVIAPLALVELLNVNQIELPFHIDIVGFCDEEGSRFGTTLLGSRALTGQWQDEWAKLSDSDGIFFEQAMLDFGLDFGKVSESKLNSDDLICYLETHIEQGPVLEREQLPVGVVTAIAGAKRLNIDVFGMAGHAGTVPMETRQDALVGASEMVLMVEKLAQEHAVVATVGKLVNASNAVNVIPGHTQFSLDIRSDNDQLRDKCLDQILLNFENIAKQRNLSITIEKTHEAPAVSCSDRLTRIISSSIEASSLIKEKPAFQLFSGAGHDAMAMADICDIGMLFVRCEKGISHHPDEQIMQQDVEVVLDVLWEFIIQTQKALDTL